MSLGAFSLRLANLDEIRATQDNLRINSASNIYVKASATYFEGDVYFKDGRFRSSSAGVNVTTNNGNFTMAPSGNIVATKEIVTTDGRISSVLSPLVLKSEGDIVLNPDPGYVVRANAPITTSDGNFVSEVDSKISTLRDDLTLSPYRYLIATVPFRTTDGSIASVAPASDLNLSSGNQIVLNNDADFKSGKVSSSNAGGLEISTSSGNLVLNPANNVQISKDLYLGTGNVDSLPGVQTTIRSGAGPVTVDGDLVVTGTIIGSSGGGGSGGGGSGGNTTPKWPDKRAVLACIESPSNTYASGSGLLIAGADYEVDPTSLSLIWRSNSGGAPCWHMSGGNFWVTRKLTTGATVTYRFDIDDDTQDLVISKQVDVGRPIPVAEFNSSS